MNYITINQKGTAHKNGECEDALFINNDETVFCLADGVSNSRYGAVGARNIVTVLGKMFSDPENKIILKDESVDSIRSEVCRVIDNILTGLCNKYNETDKEVFASTFLALVKTDKNDITLIHAGDGAIFGQPKTEQTYFATVLSYPDNSPDGRVYSAGNPEQKSRMRVIRIKQNDYKSIMLCTDGFSEAYLVPSFQAYNIDSITQAFMVKTDDELQSLVYAEHISNRAISDDISCVLCNFDCSSSRKKENSVMHMKKAKTTKVEANTANDENHSEPVSKHTPVNQIEYCTSSKKHPKEENDSKDNKVNLFVPLCSVALILISIIMCMSFVVIAKHVSTQATEMATLKEQVSEFEDRLKEFEIVSQTVESEESTMSTDKNENYQEQTTTSHYDSYSEGQQNPDEVEPVG